MAQHIHPKYARACLVKSHLDFIQRDLESEVARRGNGETLEQVLDQVSQAFRLSLREPTESSDNAPKLGTQTEIIMRMKEKNPTHSEADLKSAILCAIRLAFRIQTTKQGLTAQRPLDWPAEKTVREYVRGVFNAGRTSSSVDVPFSSEPEDSEIAAIQALLTHRLTVVNIKAYTNINIRETSYLPWHLKMYDTPDYTVLYVFRDMRWLLGAEKMQNFPVPREIIQETIETLNYLYPRDRATMKLLEREGIDLHDMREQFPDRPRFRDFKYYKPRMVDVAYEFLNPPRRWETIWKDRRNPMQFWAFWLGLLIFIFTLVFGIMATVLAGMQLKVALHPPGDG
ncbi:hypothetical protein CGCSCA5_v007256 [Colletotrichum siamense]|nr:hypothetical protein CGCSCA5_v007256 [Colletotrichum siamense]